MSQQLENFFRQRFIYAVRLTAAQEIFFLRKEDCGFFLAHCPPQKVSLSQREARQRLHNLHDLFLIKNHAESFFKYRLKFRVQVMRDFPSVLARNEVLNHART